MAATVLIREKNGAGQAATDKTSGTIRFKNADDSTVNASNPMVKPVAGTDRSYEKWLRMYIDTTGPSGVITSPVFYSDGTNNFGTGITCFIRTTNPGSYSTPAEPSDDSAGTSIFTYNSGSTKAIDAINAGPFSTTSTDFGDYMVLWMGVTTTVTAPANPTSSETITVSWSET